MDWTDEMVTEASVGCKELSKKAGEKIEDVLDRLDPRPRGPFWMGGKPLKIR